MNIRLERYGINHGNFGSLAYSLNFILFENEEPLQGDLLLLFFPLRVLIIEELYRQMEALRV